MSGAPITMSPEDLRTTIQQATEAAVRAMVPPAAAPPPASAFGGMVPAAAHPGPSAWGAPSAPAWGAAPTPAGAPAATGVSLTVTITLPDGREVPTQLLFGAEYAQPGALQALVGSLLASGVPLKVYQPRDNGGGGYGGGGRGRRDNGYGNRPRY